MGRMAQDELGIWDMVRGRGPGGGRCAANKNIADSVAGQLGQDLLGRLAHLGSHGVEVLR